MKLHGRHELDLDKSSVWDGLINRETLEYCIPGCEKLDQTDDNCFDIAVLAKIGPIKTRFTGTAQLVDIKPPDSYRLVFSGNGGSAGSAKGETTITLTEDNGKTVLNYDSEVAVTGKLAQIGNKLIDSAAKSYASQFFESFVETLKDTTPGDTDKRDKLKEAFSVTDLIGPRLKIVIYGLILVILVSILAVSLL